MPLKLKLKIQLKIPQKITEKSSPTTSVGGLSKIVARARYEF